jgi:diacylglycerol kinase family enzyme
MSKVTKHLFVLNPKSFWHQWKMEQVLAKIHGFFKITGPGDYMIHISRFPRDAAGFVEKVAQKLPKDIVLRVYAIGGDGILFDCLNGMIGLPNVELGAMPYGHTNNFVRGFGRKSRGLFRDMERAFTAPVIPLDVIRCGSHYALNFCAIGLESLAIHNALKLHGRLEEGGPVSQWLGRRLYNQLYYVGGIPACLNRKLLHQYYEIEIDGEDFSGQYRNIFIANGAFHWGHPAPSAMPNDGLLDIILSCGAGWLRTISLIPLYMQGQYSHFPKDFTIKRGQRLRIRTEEPFLASCDEVPFYNSDCTIEALPGAIHFVDASKYGYGGGGGG